MPTEILGGTVEDAVGTPGEGVEQRWRRKRCVHDNFNTSFVGLSKVNMNPIN